MDFMTPASVRNLPSYLADDRQKRILRQEVQDKKDEQVLRQKRGEFASAVLDVTMKAQNKDELYAGLGAVKSQYSRWLGPEDMQILSQGVQQWGKAQAERDTRQRELLKEQTQSADADAQSRLLMQRLGMDPGEPTGSQPGPTRPMPAREQPEREDDATRRLLMNMSPKGRLEAAKTLLGYRSDQARADQQAEEAKRKGRLTDAQIKNYEAMAKSRLNPQAGGMSDKDWQRMKTNADASLSARYGIEMDGVTPIEVDPEIANQIAADGRSLGYEVVVEPVTVDGGFLRGDKNMASVRFGAFNPGASAQPTGGARQEQSPPGASATLDDLLSDVQQSSQKPQPEKSPVPAENKPALEPLKKISDQEVLVRDPEDDRIYVYNTATGETRLPTTPEMIGVKKEERPRVEDAVKRIQEAFRTTPGHAEERRQSLKDNMLRQRTPIN